MKKCPFCAEEIQSEAIKCRYCGSVLPPTSTFGTQSNSLDPDIRQLMQAGKKIEAIKLARERHGLDLKGAKDYVEQLERGGAVVLPPPHAAAKSSARGFIGGLIGVVIFGAWLFGAFSNIEGCRAASTVPASRPRTL